MKLFKKYQSFLVGIGLSLGLHLMMGGAIEISSRFKAPGKSLQKKGKIQVKVKPVEVPSPPLPAERPKAPEKVKPPQPTAQKRPPKPSPAKPVAPIQGLTRDSFFSEGKSGFSAPVGNTLMVADDGTRVQEAAPLDGDLSADPKLLAESVAIPAYTEAALDAAFEGRVTVEVFVDPEGKVIQAEPQRKIGFGMDERIVTSALSARFLPRKDRYGQPEAGWAKITFNLQVP